MCRLDLSPLLIFIFLPLNTPNNLKIDYRKSKKERKNDDDTKKEQYHEEQLMFETTCSSLFHHRELKWAHKVREEAETVKEKEGSETLQWWDDELIIQLDRILLMLMRFIVSVSIFFFSLSLSLLQWRIRPSVAPPFIHIYVTPFSALLGSALAKCHHERAKTDTKGNIFFAAVSRGDAFSVYLSLLCERRDNLHNNDAMSFTIFDIIFCTTRQMVDSVAITTANKRETQNRETRDANRRKKIHTHTVQCVHKASNFKRTLWNMHTKVVK